MIQERLFTPKELAEAVGLSTAQVRSLMNDGRLEFVQISSKTKMVTLRAWEKFQQRATRNASLEDQGIGRCNSIAES